MKHQVVYITGSDDWEILYLDGIKILDGHHLYPRDILEALCNLNNPYELTTYELSACAEEEGASWQHVFLKSPDELSTITKWLNSPDFEQYIGTEEC